MLHADKFSTKCSSRDDGEDTSLGSEGRFVIDLLGDRSFEINPSFLNFIWAL